MGKDPAKLMTKTKDQDQGFVGWLWETVRVVLFAVLIAFVERTLFFDPYSIPSESMLPTLLVGDYLFISKYPYGYSHHSIITSPPLFEGRIFEDMPKRGDIAVFKLPRDNNTDYIKRVIGLPGDRIQMRNGALWLNGKPVERERVADFVVEESVNTRCPSYYRRAEEDGTAMCHYPRYRETLPNGVSYDTLDLVPDGPHDNTRVFIVPEGHYFMMGDNRDNSQDSRRPITNGVGYVPAENLVGRAEIIFFATDGGARIWQPWRWFQSMRYDRFFTLLR